MKQIIDGVYVDMTPAEIAQRQLEAAPTPEGIRAERDSKLASSDWVILKAFETGAAIPASWATYRQALRDVPTQAGFPNNVTWPTVPA